MPDLTGTHTVEVHGDIVVKRFRSWSGGEPRREWNALCLLAEHAPGLAPDPIESDLEADPPTVTMSRVAGAPLRGASTKPGTLEALASAITTMHGAVPRHILMRLPPCPWETTEAVAEARRFCALPLPADVNPRVAEAFVTGEKWLGMSAVEDLMNADVEPVFGHADGNLMNYLWDGVRVRVVDFEDSGRSDRAFELAEILEHPAAWVDTDLDGRAFLGHFDLTAAEHTRLRELRRLFGLIWLGMLLPGQPGHTRNPAGTLERQAARLLEMVE